MWQRIKAPSQKLLAKELKILKKHFHESKKKGVSSIDSFDDDFPKETQVVICGGGVLGAAVAYHLAIAGWGKQTILLESNRY